MPHPVADAVFWAAVLCCAVAEVAIVRSAVAARPITGGAPLPPLRRTVEVAWAVLPAVALGLVLFWTWRAMHPLPPATTFIS